MGKAAAQDAAAAVKETINKNGKAVARPRRYDDTALSGFIWIETPQRF
jgi:hypothetical protein